jgi:phytoene synthase
MTEFERITMKASKTFWLSARVFPHEIRDDVYILYAFVRTIDDYVDLQVPDADKLAEYYRQTKRAFSGLKTGNVLVDEFAALIKRRKISHKWIWDFFSVQKKDIKKRRYETWDELLQFTYGVAETIGLCMCKIMDLPPDAVYPARMLGRGMQLVNILRDLVEDEKLGKIYLPTEDLIRFGVRNSRLWDGERERLLNLVRFEAGRIEKILDEAQFGLRLIPIRYRMAVGVAADLYWQVLEKIKAQPERIFCGKVRPGVADILLALLKHWMMRLTKQGIYAI